MAHLPALVALIAGVLILIMPRLLNLVVAIYLICIGLVGLGVFAGSTLVGRPGLARLRGLVKTWCKAPPISPSLWTVERHG